MPKIINFLSSSATASPLHSVNDKSFVSGASLFMKNNNLPVWQNLNLGNLWCIYEGVKHTEQWKDVTGYVGKYQVSNFGRVKSLKRDVVIAYGSIRHHIEKIMKQRLTNHGHCRVMLPIKKKKNGVRYKGQLTHRLVAIQFIDKIFGKEIINHKDCIPTNNFYKNLEWCNMSENTKHAYDNGRFIPPKLPKFNRTVTCTKTGVSFPSIGEAAISLSISKCRLYNIACGRTPNNTTLIFSPLNIQK